MIKIVFMYEVIREKQDEYLKMTRDRIKPFWESHGCEAYTVWVLSGRANEDLSRRWSSRMRALCRAP